MMISDDAAYEVLLKKPSATAKLATFFVPRTIIYPVQVERTKGNKEIELRTFVRMYEYCSPARWEKALEIEKTYKKINAEYTKSLKDAGHKTEAKEKANPLNLTLMEDA